MNLDPADGRPVEMVLDLKRLAAAQPNAAWYDPPRRDMWRFGALMALDIRDPCDAVHIVALGEGGTPTLDYSEHPVARAAGLQLGLKDEGRAHPGFGANPTQSFKDRGMAMVVAQARRLGFTRLVLAPRTFWSTTCRRAGSRWQPSRNRAEGVSRRDTAPPDSARTRARQANERVDPHACMAGEPDQQQDEYDRREVGRRHVRAESHAATSMYSTRLDGGGIGSPYSRIPARCISIALRGACRTPLQSCAPKNALQQSGGDIFARLVGNCHEPGLLRAPQLTMTATLADLMQRAAVAPDHQDFRKVVPHSTPREHAV